MHAIGLEAVGVLTSLSGDILLFAQMLYCQTRKKESSFP